MLQVVSLFKTFKDRTNAVHALRDVSFEVSRGEVLGLIGPSGAGKSTALRAINLLERPDSGSIRLEREDLLRKRPDELRRLRQKIGMVFQHFHLLANRTVSENVALPLRIAGWKDADIRARVAEVLEVVRLADKAKAYPAKLSGGQKQRVAIARGIASRPRLLLADEPTSALDPLTKDEVLRCLEELNRELGLTLVIATHEISVVKRLCHRALLFKDHAIHEELRPANGALEARTPFGKFFLEAAS